MSALIMPQNQQMTNGGSTAPSILPAQPMPVQAASGLGAGISSGLNSAAGGTSNGSYAALVQALQKSKLAQKLAGGNPGTTPQQPAAVPAMAPGFFDPSTAQVQPMQQPLNLGGMPPPAQ